MRIHCDACSAPIEEQEAVVYTDETGRRFYFCTVQCALAADELEPGRELERLAAEPR